MGAEQSEAAVAMTHDEEEILCRATLDHIALGFDHVAMVSELLHEALETLQNDICMKSQRRAAWLHAALGFAFSNLEPVEAARHLDVALDRYEDARVEGACRRAWAWPCAILLERLAYCALRLGNAALCTSVFLKLTLVDVRTFLSNPGIAIAAQRDAVSLLTRGWLDDSIQTAVLRGFRTENSGVSQYLHKESSDMRPARSAIHLGVIEWSAWFDAAQIFVPEDVNSFNVTVEVRLRVSSPEPLPIEHFELFFRPEDVVRESLVATAQDIIQVGTKEDATGGLIPDTIYSWHCRTVLRPLRCGIVSADTLNLKLAGATASVVISPIPVTAVRGLFDEPPVRRFGRFVTLEIKHEQPRVTIKIAGPTCALAGEPSLLIVTLVATKNLPNQIAVVHCSSKSIDLDHFDLTLNGDGPTCRRISKWCFVYQIDVHSQLSEIGFWLTCHHHGTLFCKVSICDDTSLGECERSNCALKEDKEFHGTASVTHELTVLSPFVASFQMMRSPMQHHARTRTEGDSLIFQCTGRQSLKLMCNLQSSQQTPIAIRAVFYAPTSREKEPRLIFPQRRSTITRLTRHNILTVQFESLEFPGNMAAPQRLGCLLVHWSPMMGDNISFQVIETYLECPSAQVTLPTYTCKFDTPSRIYLAHPFVSICHIINNRNFPLPIDVHSGDSVKFARGGEAKSIIKLLNDEILPLGSPHMALWVGKVEFPTLQLDAQCDCASTRRKTWAFVQP